MCVQEGETVFGWNWDIVFWFTTSTVLIGTTYKAIMPADVPECPDVPEKDVDESTESAPLAPSNEP